MVVTRYVVDKTVEQVGMADGRSLIYLLTSLGNAHIATRQARKGQSCSNWLPGWVISVGRALPAVLASPSAHGSPFLVIPRMHRSRLCHVVLPNTINSQQDMYPIHGSVSGIFR